MLKSMSLIAHRPTFLEIDLSTLRKNVENFQKTLNNCEILAVVKANATGHGIVPVSQTLVEQGVKRLAVTTVEEGALLRSNGFDIPIHVISSITTKQAEDVVHYNLTASVSSYSLANAISKAAMKNNKTAQVHVKLNTGLNRFGVDPDQIIDFFEKCYDFPHLQWEGIYTHFSDADIENWEITERQFELFKKVTATLAQHGFTFPIHHVGGSAIAMKRPDMNLDMVRIGIALFGYPPVQSENKEILLKSVMTLKSEIIHLRDIPANTPVGYGGEYATTLHEKIAIIPIGHGDGYKRALSKKGEVLIKGKRVKVLGYISLDQILVNVTNIPSVKVGDEVVLLGTQKNEEITAVELADWMDSTVDEVLGSWGERIRRVYIK